MSTLGLARGTGLKRIQWTADGGIRLELLGSVDFPPAHRGTLHSHPFWELIYISAGEGSLEQGTFTLPVAQGDILLVPPGTTHRFEASPALDLDQFYLGFSFDFPPPAGVGSRPRALTRGPMADLIRLELEECLEGLKQGGPEGVLHGRLLAIAGRVIRSISPAAAQSPMRGRQESPVRMAREFLQSDLKGRHEVHGLAHRFCLSPQYFGEIFKRDTGVTVKEFQRECRLVKAIALLKEGRLSITEVAAEVGFEDIAYFSRLFKRRYGVPPRQAKSLLPEAAVSR